MADPGSKDFIESIRFAASKLGITTVRETQEAALCQYLRNRDVFVSLETGGGKSFIFQAAPLCWDFLKSKRESPSQEGSPPQRSVAIVVSPITALIEDQISTLTKKDISAIHLHRPNVDEDDQWNSEALKVRNGEVSIVYASLALVQGVRIMSATV